MQATNTTGIFIFYQGIIICTQMLFNFAFPIQMISTSAYGWFNLRFNFISFFVVLYMHKQCISHVLRL